MNAHSKKKTLDQETLYVKSCEITLHQISEKTAPTAKDIAYLQNIIQGYLLNFFFNQLSKRILNHYGVEADNRMLITLSEILSKNVFGKVRQTFNYHPEITIELSKLIVQTNRSLDHDQDYKQLAGFNHKLLNILYQEEDASKLQSIIWNNHDIKKLLLLYRFEKHISDKEARCKLSRLLEKEDEKIIMPLIKRYFNTKRYRRLADMIINDEWRIEAKFIKAHPMLYAS